MWDAICGAEDRRWLRAAVMLRSEIRRAKELLSIHPYADVTVALPDGTTTARLQRDEAFAATDRHG